MDRYGLGVGPPGVGVVVAGGVISLSRSRSLSPGSMEPAVLRTCSTTRLITLGLDAAAAGAAGFVALGAARRGAFRFGAAARRAATLFGAARRAALRFFALFLAADALRAAILFAGLLRAALLLAARFLVEALRERFFDAAMDVSPFQSVGGGSVT